MSVDSVRVRDDSGLLTIRYRVRKIRYHLYVLSSLVIHYLLLVDIHYPISDHPPRCVCVCVCVCVWVRVRVCVGACACVCVGGAV